MVYKIPPGGGGKPYLASGLTKLINKIMHGLLFKEEYIQEKESILNGCSV